MVMKIHCSKEMVREDLLYSGVKDFFSKAMLSINENDWKSSCVLFENYVSSLFDPMKFVVMLNKCGDVTNSWLDDKLPLAGLHCLE